MAKGKLNDFQGFGDGQEDDCLNNRRVVITVVYKEAATMAMSTGLEVAEGNHELGGREGIAANQGPTPRV